MSLFKSYPFRQCWCIFSLPMCTPISKEKKKEVQSITCKLTLRDSNADIPHRGTLCFFLPWEMLSFQRHTTSAYFTICVGVLWAHKWSQWRVIKGLATIATYFIFELQKKKSPTTFATKALCKEQLSSYTGVFFQLYWLKAQTLSLYFCFCCLYYLHIHAASILSPLLFWHPPDGEC